MNVPDSIRAQYERTHADWCRAVVARQEAQAIAEKALRAARFSRELADGKRTDAFGPHADEFAEFLGRTVASLRAETVVQEREADADEAENVRAARRLVIARRHESNAKEAHAVSTDLWAHYAWGYVIPEGI